MTLSKPWAACALVLVLNLNSGASIVRAGDAPARLDREALDREVRRILAGSNQDRHDKAPPIRAGLWVGAATGAPLYASQAETDLPTASAVKTAFLIELFARYADALDRPAPGLDAILADDHPAVAHFTPAQRAEIRAGLKEATVRRIGGVMMGSAPASNLVYNAAANVATALLGGPEGLTQAIQRRDPAFASIQVRRYMLADRRARGDNEATPAALAAVLQRLAARQVPGLSPATVDDVRRAVIATDEPGLGRRFKKNGDLASDPVTHVESGWLEHDGRAIVYTVMLAQSNPSGRNGDETHRRLAETARRLADTLVQAARQDRAVSTAPPSNR